MENSKDQALSSPVTKMRRVRRVTPAAAPPALQAKVNRSAKIIQRHQKVLGSIGIEALRVATLQVVAQQLADLQALLQANGFAGGLRAVPAAAPAPTGPTCALCGRPGVYQSKTARVEKGKQRPWACEAHAPAMRAEDRQPPMEAIVPKAVDPAGAPNIAAAMAALSGNA